MTSRRRRRRYLAQHSLSLRKLRRLPRKPGVRGQFWSFVSQDGRRATSREMSRCNRNNCQRHDVHAAIARRTWSGTRRLTKSGKTGGYHMFPSGACFVFVVGIRSVAFSWMCAVTDSRSYPRRFAYTWTPRIDADDRGPAGCLSGLVLRHSDLRLNWSIERPLRPAKRPAEGELREIVVGDAT